MQRSQRFNLGLALAFAASCAIFYLFSYNSGYGYDTLEYLVIGRSIVEGVPFYTYLPSKSPAIYYLIAGLYELGVDFDHASLAAVITGIYALTVAATYWTAARWFSPRAAIAVSALTALAAFFMEMNFLQPTALFYVCGLVAFDALLRFDRSRDQRLLFLAGIMFGVGIVIKSSAAFYGLAAGHYLILLGTRRQKARYEIAYGWLLKCGLSLAAGVLVVLALVFAYYWRQGAAQAFLDWTFVFPFAHYPSTTTYLSKAYTKLLWINVFVLACFPLLIDKRVRGEVLGSRPAVLALLFGVCSYLALLKTQSSHYYFPGAPFLLMFAVAVYESKFRDVQWSRALFVRGAAAVGAIAIVFGVSIALYRPDAVRRFTAIKDFSSAEQPIREFVQSHVPPDRYLLITGGELASTWTYWISHRYPPPPFVNMDVKTIWMLRHQPADVFKVLDNPALVLVQFDPMQLQKPGLEDVFGNLPTDRDIMREYLAQIKSRFQPDPAGDSPATFWRRLKIDRAAMNGL